MYSHLLLLAVSNVVYGHGYVRNIIVDGTTYPGFQPMIDRQSNVKRIEWGFTTGPGPVLDVTAPEITCRKGASPPALRAPVRAGAEIKFQWSDYFTSHKGPILTYMGRMDDPNMKPQDVEFFKIDEGTYNPKTGVWGSDTLIKNNNTWAVATPSDIKPGKYIVRHELIALHFGAKGNPNGAGTSNTGAQMYPICINVEVIGTGTKTPPGVKFPGGYSPKDAGILANIYFGPNIYISPGPPVYQGERKPPIGNPPVVKETGALTGKALQMYNAAASTADAMFHSVVKGVNDAIPGGGGVKTPVKGNPGLVTAPNGGKPFVPLEDVIISSPFPAGVVPGIGANTNAIPKISSGGGGPANGARSKFLRVKRNIVTTPPASAVKGSFPQPLSAFMTRGQGVPVKDCAAFGCF